MLELGKIVPVQSGPEIHTEFRIIDFIFPIALTG